MSLPVGWVRQGAPARQEHRARAGRRAGGHKGAEPVWVQTPLNDAIALMVKRRTSLLSSPVAWLATSVRPSSRSSPCPSLRTPA
jgi:hypothetical protein